MAVKFKNVIGTEFPNYVSKQLENRKKIVEKTNRDSKDLLWLTNRTGWFRMSSGAYINGDDTLAKQYILQGGTVIKGNEEGTVALREGFNNSYEKGPLGFKPMPGITSLSINTGGRWQTLLQGEVEIIAYDRVQLDRISKLYMSLGVHVFIEWGHKPYIDKTGKVNTTPDIKPIDIFKYKGSNQRRNILKIISDKKRELEGNYEALLGRVYNFDYNANPDGTYTCKIKVMGPGAMVDSLRDLSNFNGKDNDAMPPTEDEATKYQSDFENALNSIKKVLNHLLKPTVKNNEGQILSINSSNFFKKNEDLLTKAGNLLAGSDYYTKPSYGQVLNSIYNNCNYKSTGFLEKKDTGEGYVYFSNELARYGHASQKIHDIEGKDNSNLLPITTGFFNGYVSSLVYQKIGWAFPETVKSTYITLGHLFSLVQHLGIFVEKSGEPQPAIQLDYHPDNTIVNTAPIQASIDPSICLVPFQNRSNKYNVGLGLFLNPLNISNTEVYSFQGSTTPNSKKNFTSDKVSNVINGNIPEFDGKLFNILINIDFALNTLENIKKSTENRVATIREYLEKILEGVNRALGGVNSFRINFLDCSQTLRVVDENYIPESITYLELPVFGNKSIAYDYSYSSKISKELSSQIVIASQGSESDIKNFPEEVLTYFELNGGISDRFTDPIVPSVKCDPENDEDAEGNIKEDISKLRSPQNLFDQLYLTYVLPTEEPYNRGVSEALFNYYHTLQQKYINIFSFSPSRQFKSGVLIPLEMSVTMDGISGILPYNAFLLPNNVLPERYKNKVAFIVFSVNHDLNNNKWTTTLRGQTIIRPEKSLR